MKRLQTIFVLCTGILLNASAQTFTQRLQQKQGAGQGTVTIHQSADIDELVNNSELMPRGSGSQQVTAPTTDHSSPAFTSTPRQPSADTHRQLSSNNSQQSAATTNPIDDETVEPAPVDLTKKMMRGGVKVTGYRVQVFAGGNKRTDRQQAERISREIKMHYANVPVYVHFYSPRWICRVGNYRTYEEAHQMLSSLRKLGYNQATIVKGKITIAY